MFNRSYHVRARGGGRKLAADAALHLPWAGIFEPWRPLVLVAAAAESAAKRCKKRSGRLQGVQLELAFADPAQNGRKLPADSDFPLLSGLEVPMNDDDRPLADIFPEAYL